MSALATAACARAHAPAPPHVRSIEGNWQVVEVKGQAMPATSEFRMRFVNGRFSGRFGCNFMGGAYLPEGNLLHVAQLSSTRMACTERGTAIERDAGLILRPPMIMSWTGRDHLELTNRAGGIKLKRLR